VKTRISESNEWKERPLDSTKTKKVTIIDRLLGPLARPALPLHAAVGRFRRLKRPAAMDAQIPVAMDAPIPAMVDRLMALALVDHGRMGWKVETAVVLPFRAVQVRVVSLPHLSIPSCAIRDWQQTGQQASDELFLSHQRFSALFDDVLSFSLCGFHIPFRVLLPS
jgi:hypothetical protein